MRDFYESLPDLKATLPSIFFENVEPAAPIDAEAEADEAVNPDLEEAVHSSPLEALLAKLPEAFQVNLIDHIAGNLFSLSFFKQNNSAICKLSILGRGLPRSVITCQKIYSP